MSDAMSSVEIEDVLSSIRRLVSQDLRQAPRSVDTESAPAEPTAQPPQVIEKLILTPAFRVVTSTPALTAALPRLHLGAEPVARVVAATLERAVVAQSAEWESEVGDPPLFTAHMQWTDAGWSAPSAEVVQFPATATATPQAVPPYWAQAEPELDGPDQTAAPAAPIAEPDPVWADQAEAEAVAALDAAAQAAGHPAELRLDEQVLRELVRELVLAELQGSLGERMTRNIRKLVRAEMAQAMATHRWD